MKYEKNPLTHRDLLITALAIQNDLADPQQVSKAIEQAMLDTDGTYFDSLKQVTNLDDESFATLNALADLKSARHNGDVESVVSNTLDRDPGVLQSLISIGLAAKTTGIVTHAVTGSRLRMSSDDLPVSSRYNLSRVHARGGLGQVWRAFDRLLAREVAIKEILPGISAVDEVNQRFLQEAKITGQLEHPSIVPVYDIGRLAEGDRPFYAMRFVEGETLDSRIGQFHQIPATSEESSLQLRQLLNNMVSICNAVGFAHSRKILHRDLKPQNVILGNFGEVSVLDWGLARHLGSDDNERDGQVGESSVAQVDLTSAGSIIGTPTYMAPEQARGETARLTEASDIYALGTILYQVLTGQPPVVEPDLKKLIERILNERTVSPREKNAHVAPPLASICLKALEKDPADRYLSATEMASDLNRFLADEKVSAHDESMVEQARRWIRKHRTLVASGAAAMLVAMAGLLIASVLLNAARQRETTAKQKIESQKSTIELARNDLEKTNGKLELTNANLKLANRKVEKSLQDARDAIDHWYTIVATNKELANTPNSTDFRKQLLQKASDYYETFLKQLPENESLKLSAAQSHVRLAAIKLELEPGLAAVPHFEQAKQIYTSLLKERPGDRDLNFALAGVFNDQSAAFYQVNQMEKALELLDKVEAIYVELSETVPGDPELKSKIATLKSNRGEFFLKLNRLTECIDAYTDAIEAHQQLVESNFEAAKSRQAIANGHYRRGAARIKLKDFDVARDDLEKAIATQTELRELEPDNPKPKSDLINMLSDFGSLTLATGDNPTAQSTYRKTIELAEELAEDFPSVPTYRRNLVLAHANLARSMSAAKDLENALDSYRAAQKAAVDLVNQFPDVPQYISLKSDLAINFGILLANLGRNQDAIQQFENAAQVQKSLTENHPDFIRYAISLVNTRNNLAAMHLRNNDLEKSNEVTETLIDDCQRFVKRWPKSIDLQLTLASVFSNRAATQSQTGQSNGADSDFQSALKIRLDLASEFPDNLEVAGDLAESFNNYGVYLTFVGAINRARDYLKQAVETRRNLADRNPGITANTDLAISVFAYGQAHMNENPQRANDSFSESIELLVAAIELAPQYDRAQRYLTLAGQSRAWARWDIGEADAAISDMEQLLHIETPRVQNETRASLAYFYLKSGRIDEGTSMLDEIDFNSIVTTRSQFDLAAAHAFRRGIVLADDSLAGEKKDQLAKLHLQQSLAGLKAALENPDITSNKNWESILVDQDFAPISSSEAFKQIGETPDD